MANGSKERTLELPRSLVEYVLLGPTDDRRQLQDSPILGDVWIAYASDPTGLHDLLITPHKNVPAGRVARYVHERVAEDGRPRESGQEAKIAYLQGIVAARLYFDEVLRFLVPATKWWHDKKMLATLKPDDPQKTDEVRQRITQTVRTILIAAGQRNRVSVESQPPDYFDAPARYIALAGLILWAGRTKIDIAAPGPEVDELLTSIDTTNIMPGIMKALLEVFDAMLDDPMPLEPLIFQISLNRKATAALERSVPAVKADAARTLFAVKCDQIAWAVLDSGIDRDHTAFQDPRGDSRVEQVFDFSRIREIVSLDNLKPEIAEQRLDVLLNGRTISRGTASNYLRQLAENAREDLPIDWGLVTHFVDVAKPDKPYSPHGTHVAGILGAYGGTAGGEGYASGMCPDIRLYDFRVLAKSIEDTEFAIIAALQYIRYLNERKTHMTIHGANLSLSIPHSVRNYACGRTPICVECERLVDSGVTVVAAAGNRGYQSFQTTEGLYESYAAFSITDPGNADGVITVGSTHGHSPHAYGVSFFSSRGPTGDGRMKPDLVAPGERVWAPLPGDEWGQLDGTSMAAPHVSGAAAMLMARYSELIGQPRRIKRILCESTTDLGRDRSFQGHGMLDVLRAFQSI